MDMPVGTTRIIAAIAGQRHGVVTTAELVTAGVSRSSISRRVAAGTMMRLDHGVFYVGASVPHVARLAAAVAAAPGTTALGLQTAAELHSIWHRGPTSIEVVTDRRVRRTIDDVSYVRSSDLAPSDIVELDGLRVTTVSRTILDLGRVLTPHQIAHVVYEASFLRVFDRAEVELLLDGTVCSGCAKVRSALALFDAGSAGTRSRSEDHLLAALLRGSTCRRSSRVPLVNVRGATPVLGFEPDFAWPRARLVVEVDGPGHDRPEVRAQDALTDSELIETGWRVMRIPAGDVWRRTNSVVRSIQRAVLHA